MTRLKGGVRCAILWLALGLHTIAIAGIPQLGRHHYCIMQYLTVVNF
jgi:hypothetical protein